MAELYKNINKKWYAVYTRSRWEKKIDSILGKKGIDSWCPVYKKERRWSDRVKVIDEPLFSSYLFVQVAQHEIQDVLQTEGVLFIISKQKQPVAIRPEEIQAIRKYLLEDYESVTVYQEHEFYEKQPVLISKGVLMNERGSVIEIKHKKVIIRIESMERILVVEFEKEFIEPLPFSRS